MERVVLFDLDNVIYDGHAVFDVIQSQESDRFIRKGVWNEVEEELNKYKQKEVSYKAAADKMLATWARSLQGKTYESAVDYVRKFFDTHPDKFFAWFPQILPSLKISHDIFIVTTNYQFIAEAVTNRFGLMGHLSSQAEVVNGVFTGSVKKSLAGNKGEVVDLLKEYPTKGSIAVGDSANDIKMLETVEHPICFQPDARLLSVAKKKNWRVVDHDSVMGVIENILQHS